MAARLADFPMGINREHEARKPAASWANSAAVPLCSGKIPLFGRFISADPWRSGIAAQAIDLPWYSRRRIGLF
jgi:hypothetical protein